MAFQKTEDRLLNISDLVYKRVNCVKGFLQLINKSRKAAGKVALHLNFRECKTNCVKR